MPCTAQMDFCLEKGCRSVSNLVVQCAMLKPERSCRYWYKGAQPTLQEDLPFHVHSKDHDHQVLQDPNSCFLGLQASEW